MLLVYVTVAAIICCAEPLNGLTVLSTDKPSCIVTTDQGRLDLSPLAGTDDTPFVYPDDNGNAFDGEATVLFNPCNDVNPSSHEECQGEMGEYFVLTNLIPPTCTVYGTKSSSAFDTDNDQLVLKYTLQQDVYKVIFQCNKIDPPQFTLPDPSDPTTSMLSGDAVCFTGPGTTPSSGGRGGGGGGLSAGSVLIIICVVLLFLYVVVGVLVMKFVKKAQGPEMILNLSFWKEFPGRVKDGFLFVIRGCKVRGSYESME